MAVIALKVKRDQADGIGFCSRPDRIEKRRWSLRANLLSDIPHRIIPEEAPAKPRFWNMKIDIGRVP